jgi:hypothetical protein
MGEKRLHQTGNTKDGIETEKDAKQRAAKH